MDAPLCLKCSRPLILSAMDPSGSGPAWKCLPCELCFTREQLDTFKPGDWAELQLVPFLDLALGARFRYPGSGRLWTKISPTTIAEWNPREATTRWVGQSVCGEYTPATLVEYVPDGGLLPEES